MTATLNNLYNWVSCWLFSTKNKFLLIIISFVVVLMLLTPITFCDNDEVVKCISKNIGEFVDSVSKSEVAKSLPVLAFSFFICGVACYAVNNLFNILERFDKFPKDSSGTIESQAYDEVVQKVVAINLDIPWIPIPNPFIYGKKETKNLSLFFI